jgi:hypothetical protein
VRLSPYEPTAPGVAPWFANQSIDGIDSIALAVWGTNVAIGGREVAEAIYGQLLVSGKPVGTPRRLTPPDARPFVHCKVIVVGGRFAVLWNDARGDTSIMVQFVDRTGELEGEPRIFSDGVVVQQGQLASMAFGPREGGRLIAWADGRGSINHTMLRRIEADGSFDAPELIIGKTFNQLRRYPTLSGTTFICALDSTAMVDSAGTLHLPLVSTTRFQLAHAITADSTFLLLRDTSLVYYPNPLSTKEIRVIPIPNLRGVPDAMRAVSLPVHDTIQVVYAIYGHSQVQFFSFSVVDSIVSSTNFFYTTAYKPYCPPRFDECEYSIEQVDRHQPCGNGAEYRVLVVYQYYNQSYGRTFEKKWDYFQFAESGVFFRQATCPEVVNPRYGITRRNDDSRTDIATTIDGAVSVFPLNSVLWVNNRVQKNPGVFSRKNTLFVAWQQDTINPKVSIGSWRLVSPDTADISGNTEEYVSLLPLNNASFAVQSLTRLTTATIRELPAYETMLDIRAPKDGKFVSLLKTWSGQDRLSSEMFLAGAAEDPNSGESIVAVQLFPAPDGYMSGRWKEYVVRISSDGTIASAVDSSRPTTQLGRKFGDYEIVPVNDSLSYWIQGSRLYSRVGSSWVDTLQLPPTPHPAHYQRLYGPHFLRWFETDSTGREIAFQRFSIDGILLDSSRLRADIPVRDLRVVPDPRDSSVLVIYSNTEGLRLLGFRPALDRIDIDTLLVQSPSAASPSAVVRHDSLFVVWQGIGEGGGMDIYGLRLRLPRGGKPAVTGDTIVHDTSGSHSERGVRDLHAVPNPASESVELRYHLIEIGNVALEIVDDRGVVVGRDQREEESAGEHHRTVSVAALPSGAYALVLRGDGWSQGVRVVVVR